MKKNSMIRPFNLGPFLLHITPKIKFIYRIATSYCNWYNGENNVWADTNGEFFILKKIIPTCKTVFDVGANVGDWSRKALEINPKLEIHCFEAAKDNYSELLNSGIDVRFNNVAVSEHTGTTKLKIFGKNSPFNSIVAPNSTDIGSILDSFEVNMISLDEYAFINNINQVNFVKIDVEGAEYNVLMGMKNLLSNKSIDVVQLEHGSFSIYSKTLIKDYFDFLQRFDFVMFKIVQNKLKLFDIYTTKIENFNHQNWICIRKDSTIFTTLNNSASFIINK